jgi:hypothetical protein
MSYENISSEELIKRYWENREKVDKFKNGEGYLMYDLETYHSLSPYMEEIENISFELMRRGVSLFLKF